MKKSLSILTIVFCLVAIISNGQIPIYNINNQKTVENVVLYDSLTNISEIYNKHRYGNDRYRIFRGMIGQKIIFNPALSIHNQSYMPQLCWRELDNHQVQKLIGKELQISGVFPEGILDNPVFILSDNETDERFQYEPDACGMEPFLSLGYFEWMVNTYKGKDWWYKNLYPSENQPCLINSNTNEIISSDAYVLLNCTDVQLKLPQKNGYSLFDKGGVVLLFGDSIGNQYYINMGFDNAGESTYSGWRGKPQIGIAHILLSLEQRQNEINEQVKIAQRVKAEDEHRKNKCIKLFGKDKGMMVYLGIVELGMTKDMCIEALGEPYKINSSQSRNEIFEQWVYPNKYVYFQNGKIVSIDRFE